MDYLATVLIITYNHEDYIERTLKSAINQKSRYPFKIWVIDDCSTDNNQEKIDGFLNNYHPSEIVKTFNPRNVGLNANIEYAFQNIDTKYTLILGGDDYWIDEKKIEKEIDVLESNPEISFIHTGYQTFDEKRNMSGRIINKWKWNYPQNRKKRVVDFFAHKFTYYPVASTACFRTSIIKEGLQKYTKLLHSYLTGEGTFLHVSQCMLGGDYHYLQDITTIYTVREESLSHFKDQIDFFKFAVNYFKTQLDALHLIGVDPKYESQYIIKHLITLLYYSHKFNKPKVFEDLLDAVGKDLPLCYIRIFKISNHSTLIKGCVKGIQRIKHIRKQNKI